MQRFFPEQASTFAPKVDWLHGLVTDISVFFTVAIVGAMIYFAIKYRKRNGVDHETPRIEGNHTLEVIWTVVPTIICVIVAYYGVIYWREMRIMPDDAMVVNVRGQKWLWNFEYDSGKKTIGELVVPVNRPTKLVLTSSDVLHSFFIPAMRVKKDAVPGMYTTLWFQPVKTGTYPVFCTEYCGLNHSAMLSQLRVVSEAEFGRWVNDRSEEFAALKLPPSVFGAKLYKEKGCIACHSLDGTRLVGPSFLGIVSREHVYDGGKKDERSSEEYIRESIVYPNKHIVDGYPANLMQSYEGQLSENDISSLIAFMRSIKAETEAVPTPAAVVDLSKLSPAERGRAIYQSKACSACHSLDGTNLALAPSFKGLYGREEELKDGTKVIADDAYITRSIKNPAEQIVKGYEPSMPAGLVTNDSDIQDLIEFIKTIK